ncbi:MAG: toxin-activating lysine-acyltransferase [Paracoccaceae bacterium]|jgi:cytolysin-activating lysine-acyltransferase|nr:toxin-activating lysine-acyltransferase [Paracoccaceae bacterium]MDP7186785.1 toxin-activating lysine-acyltransferase [Paracoccaceae bacterium]
MTQLTDKLGQSLPKHETPSDDLLRVYGDAFFLAMRCPRHRQMSMQEMRLYLEPPIVQGSYRVFRIQNIPRGMFTWAMLSPDAERRLIEGEVLHPGDWNSGDRRWIIDIIAPYRGMMQGIARWIMHKGNFTDTQYYFRRVSEINETRRIVEVDFEAERLSKIWSAEDYLKSLKS